MSYYEQAEEINKLFKKLDQNTDNTDNKDNKEKLINAILRFGQVAKFRCRSNTAYDNFSKLCFQDIAELERVKPEGLEFEILRVSFKKA